MELPIKRLSQKQKDGLEIVTGREWNTWHPEAVSAYFAFTDKGQKVEVSRDAQLDLYNLLFAHKFHPVSVEMWKEDFKRGLLFLDDFLLAEFDGTFCSDRYIQHAFEVYEDIMGFIPGIFREDMEELV